MCVLARALFRSAFPAQNSIMTDHCEPCGVSIVWTFMSFRDTFKRHKRDRNDKLLFLRGRKLASALARHAEPHHEARRGTSVLWWSMPLVCRSSHSGGECKWGLAELASASNGAIRKWTHLQSFVERKLRILQRLDCWSDGGAR